MVKYFFLFLALNTFPFYVSATPIDTAVVFFGRSGKSVRTLDSADYYMLILPPTPGDASYNIQQFYKNGKIKLIGKGDANENSMKTGLVRLIGDCTMYYPGGNKSGFVHYTYGYKDGLEYLYYPNGNALSVIKHTLPSSSVYAETYYWDCYDDKGNSICKNGNGRWVMYDDSGKYIRTEGQVNGGHREGDWTGKIFVPDTISYVDHYKHNRIQSSVGYNKNGKAYPFYKDYELATYRSGWLIFIERLRSRIKLPKDTNGLKISIDTMHISFVIEKDGKLTQFKMLGDIDPNIKAAVFAALEKCDDWVPSTVYGVPFRTQIIIPLSEISGYKDYYAGTHYQGSSYQKEISYKEKIIKGN
ncbi:MAG: hypothetical protein ACHQHN_12915 [Sphingobacteriales bacterium]